MKKLQLNRMMIPVSFCLLFLFCQWTPKKVPNKYHYRGNVSIKIYLDTALMTKLGNITVYDQYVFENAETTHSFGTIRLNTRGEVTDTKNQKSYSTLDSFMLTNVKTNTCFMFGKDSIKPLLRSKIPVSQKKIGLQLKDNLDDLKPYIDGVTFLKDTLINGDKIKLLISDQSDKHDSKGIKKIIFYLNTDMIDFPFHPASKLLDEKFGGVIFKFSYISTTGRIQNMVYNYTDGLSKTDTRKVQRFIKATGTD